MAKVSEITALSTACTNVASYLTEELGIYVHMLLVLDALENYGYVLTPYEPEPLVAT